MLEQLNDEVLSAYAVGFYGYGSSTAPYCFVGMEEGGGKSLNEVEARLVKWDERGRREFEDLFEFHEAVGMTQWVSPQAKIQSTWGSLYESSCRRRVKKQHLKILGLIKRTILVEQQERVAWLNYFRCRHVQSGIGITHNGRSYLNYLLGRRT